MPRTYRKRVDQTASLVAIRSRGKRRSAVHGKVPFTPRRQPAPRLLVVGMRRGQRQLSMNMLAIAMGGHARTGLEDNLYYCRGKLAQSNAQLVARLTRIARESGREPATPAEARVMLGLTGTGC